MATHREAKDPQIGLIYTISCQCGKGEKIRWRHPRGERPATLSVRLGELAIRRRCSLRPIFARSATSRKT